VTLDSIWGRGFATETQRAQREMGKDF
jgi:hypothetical protein